MKDNTRNFVVGITALAGIIGLAALLMLFGQVPRWLSKGYLVRVEMANAAGVGTSSRIRLDGIDIGRVVTVELQERPKRGVVLSLEVNPDIRIPVAAVPTVRSPLIGGSPSLGFDTIDLTDEELTVFLPTDGSAVIEAPPAASLSSMAGQFRGMITESVDKIRVDLQAAIARFDGIANDFNALSQQWTAVGKNLTDMTEHRPMDRVDAGELPPNITTLITRADRRIDEAKQTLVLLNDLLGDEQLKADIKAAVGSAKTAMGNLELASGDARKLVADLKPNADQMMRRMLAVADDLSGAIGSARKVIDQAGSGQGAVGKLLNDPSLYENLNDTVVRVGQAVDELKLLIAKWKAEGMRVNF